MGTNRRQVWQEKDPDYVSARAWNILAPDGLCHVCLGIILPEVVYGDLYRFHPSATSINRYPDPEKSCRKRPWPITDRKYYRDRSEEDTSDLQPRFDLVCRLLPEINNHRATG